MATYKIDDVLTCLSDMKKDGFKYIDISISEVDDDDEDHTGETLFIEAISPDLLNEEEIIDSIEIPEDYFDE